MSKAIKTAQPVKTKTAPNQRTKQVSTTLSEFEYNEFTNKLEPDAAPTRVLRRLILNYKKQ